MFARSPATSAAEDVIAAALQGEGTIDGNLPRQVTKGIITEGCQQPRWPASIRRTIDGLRDCDLVIERPPRRKRSSARSSRNCARG